MPRYQQAVGWQDYYEKYGLCRQVESSASQQLGRELTLSESLAIWDAVLRYYETGEFQWVHKNQLVFAR